MARSRTWLALGTTLTALLLSVAMLGGTASAGTTTTTTAATAAKTGPDAPLAAKAATTWSGCNRNICLSVEAVSERAIGGTIRAIVKAWPRFGGYSFDGHYQLFVPTRVPLNSGRNQVFTHSKAWTKNEFLRPKGKWCVIGWRYNGGNSYTNLGYPCVTVTK
jgi:hypothetical protein